MNSVDKMQSEKGKSISIINTSKVFKNPSKMDDINVINKIALRILSIKYRVGNEHHTLRSA